MYQSPFRFRDYNSSSSFVLRDSRSVVVHCSTALIPRDENKILGREEVIQYNVYLSFILGTVYINK
jgi:hypothetical protein